MAKRSADDNEKDSTKKMRTVTPLRKVEFNPDRIYYQFVLFDTAGMWFQLLLDPTSVSTYQLEAILNLFEKDFISMFCIFEERDIDDFCARDTSSDVVGDWTFPPLNVDLRKNNQYVKVAASYVYSG